MTDSLTDRVRGGLFGLLIGDALGVPFEFRTAAQLPAVEEIDCVLPLGFRRSHRNAPAGAWSDDGAHALCLLASLLHCNTLDLSDLSNRLVDWLESGYLAVEGRVFDVGIQTTRALNALRSGVPPERSGPADERSNGNGALMRVLPLALWHRGSDSDLIRDAARQSIITHGHVRSQICCALYCMWARGSLQRLQDPWAHAVQTVRTFAASDPDWLGELDDHIRPEQPAQGAGSGYVVDCLHSARLAMEQGCFADVIRHAIALGNDTDTTAAVAGGIAGIRFGYSAIPTRWIDHLAATETVEALAQPLLQRLEAG
ncbi:MAG TPA: ADP-ribosylglycohydrolase family protein [Polyangiaceae bacterium]|nr:ADP-ribosylglycohydrolase family protein [Polyangiaceae bacterium]